MSEFVITTAGLAAAAAASPTGPYVEIVAFKLGSDATTAALVTDTTLVGSTVYSGVPSSYSMYDATTVQINLEIPASAGPFDYGEIGLYLPGNVLFARFSYGAMRRKTESSTSGYANTLRIKGLLRLAGGVALFNFNASLNQSIIEVASLLVLQTPVDYPDAPVVIVHEPTDFQESVSCYRHSATLWNIENYTKIGTASITAASDSTHVTATLFSSLSIPASSLGKYIIQTQGGYLRTVSGVSGTVATLASAINTAALIGQTVAVYQINSTLFAELLALLGNLNSSIGGIGSAVLAMRPGVPAGAIHPFAMSTPPSGYLECNGAVISRTTYAVLFTAIGTTWNTGGEPGTDFRLPDLRGKFLRSWDNGRGVDSGRAFASNQADELKSHTHGGVPSLQGDIDRGSASSSFSIDNTGNTAATGGSETRPINVAVMYCIKT